MEFYALPFVKKPLEHATFKTLFRREWVHNLTEKLNTFLDIEEKRMQATAKTLGKSESDTHKHMISPTFPEPNLRELEEKNRLLFEEVEQFRGRYASLEKNNQALIEAFNSHLM